MQMNMGLVALAAAITVAGGCNKAAEGGGSEESPEKKCENGDMTACYELGMTLLKGSPEEMKKSGPMLTKACNGGHGPACFTLGELAASVDDKPRQLQFFKQGCDAKHGESCFELGKLAINDRQSKIGGDLFLDACKYGSGMGCTSVGEALSKGLIDGEVDLKLAATYYEKGCNADVGYACHRAGLLAATDPSGHDAPIQRGEQLLAKACKLGHTESCGGLPTGGSAPGGGGGAPAARKGQTLKAAGIEWNISSALADRFILKKVKCDAPYGTQGRRICHLTIKVPLGWDTAGGDGFAMATVYDEDDVQTGQMHVSPNEAKRGTTVRQKLQVTTTTKRVDIE